MIEYLKTGYNIDVIDKAIEKLKKKKCFTDFEKNDRKNSIEALESFLEVRIPELLLDFSLSKPKRRLNLLENGLHVSFP